MAESESQNVNHGMPIAKRGYLRVDEKMQIEHCGDNVLSVHAKIQETQVSKIIED